VGDYKNIVGSFFPPERVLIDPNLAVTLSVEQRVAGLCEAAKICFCHGTQTFTQYRALSLHVSMNYDEVRCVVALSLMTKKWFIETDEFDKGERLLLNFGHTFGHALEGASHYKISHGVAVGLGILCALALGRGLGTDYTKQDHTLFLEGHMCELLAQIPQLHESFVGVTVDALLDRFKADKKHGKQNYNVVIVDDQGQVILKSLPKNQQIDQQIAHAMRGMLDQFADKKIAA
jgi:3-dehydroquinate synthase